MESMSVLNPEVPLSNPASMSDGSPNPSILVPDTTPPASRDSPNTTSSATSEARPTQPPTTPAACLGCRSKHLKCDGQNPCGRCRASESECVYVASRRGYKGPRRGTAANPNKRARSSSPPTSTVSIGDSCPMLLGATTSAAMPVSMAPYALGGPVLPNTPQAAYAATPHLSDIHNLQLYRPFGNPNGYQSNQLSLSHHGGLIPTQGPAQTPAERCLDSFYRHFHAGHPFVLPKAWLFRVLGDADIEPLLAAMRWVGSLFVDVGPARAAFFDEAIRLVQDPSTKKDGFLVQALTLLIVGTDGSCQQEKARQLLADAERIALEIELNTRAYATVHGRGIPILEESWRRTWWDLYVVDGMVAGVHRQTNFLLFDVPADVGLPCEEHQFLSGNIPQPMYLEDLEDREFSGETREFSSFSYRIAAGRNLGKFMRVPPIFGPEDENLARIEALLTNWRMHLPPAKRDALSQKLQSDEMIFQASMMTHATSIMLHQPHSQLDSSPTRSVTSCAPHRPVPSGDYFNAHTNHTVASAAEISRMITHRVPLLSHTHFFTCVITLSSIVHLCRWALIYIPHDDDELRQQLRLNIGALSELSPVWRAADTALGQVRGVAQEIYRAKKASQINPGYWTGYSSEEVMTSIATDETIMNEIEVGLPTGMPSMDGI
ncbi:hypothetical protein HYQ45_000795 [Verticillium longisporum]|uniref:Zn(2)-C6 fungal-type domain-containing protein n=3 Tax=Verticillium TaxID=1036719 RepID=A0A8I3A3G5_VERLO|nr:NADH-ubiquinone oxidoreductase 12 kDa subunit [Verticillium dahliae VDG2]KAG7142878.1 hypothetical protein HYQ45_000795 [Verticillium longisporum]PNH35206.1 hypothetical protein BJF96_g1666 [Verticillium dahliae]PNH42522.1 hypothetical protein VD0004_g4792 [Verticillium dahliae]PNH56538.1 hypothetical protein VD0003_g1169 [Verticillium dahliae]